MTSPGLQKGSAGSGSLCACAAPPTPVISRSKSFRLPGLLGGPGVGVCCGSRCMRERGERPAALVRGVWAQGGGGLSGCDSCPAAVGSPCGALGARFPGLRPGRLGELCRQAARWLGQESMQSQPRPCPAPPEGAAGPGTPVTGGSPQGAVVLVKFLVQWGDCHFL